MEDFKIKGAKENIGAMMHLLLEINISIKTQNEFFIQNIQNGLTEEENFKDFIEISEKYRKQTLEALYLKFGDLNLGDILR